MAIATLSIDLEMRLAKLEQGLDKAARSTDRAAKQIEDRLGSAGEAVRNFGAMLAGAVSIGALGAFAKATIDGIDALNDLADATGASIENLSALEDTALRTGTSMDTAGSALVKLNQLLNSAEPDSGAARALEAIGLSVDDLKAADPVDALESVAKALAQYEDDANKARLVQELFGKSARELAPLLKDLAESGKGVATVTAEQAAEAERFNKALFQLQKETQDASRSILSSLLPAISDVIADVNAATRAFGGLGNAMMALGPFARGFQSPTEALVHYRKELDQVIERMNTPQTGRMGLFNRAVDPRQTERLQEQAAELRKYIEYYERVLRMDPAGSAGGGRGFMVPGLERPSAPSVPGTGPRDRPAAPPAPPRFDLPDTIRGALDAIKDTDVVKVQALREQLSLLLTLDQTPAVTEAIATLTERIQALDPAAQAAAKSTERLNDLIGRTGKVAQEASDLALLDDAFFGGAISAAEFEAGLARIYKGLNELPDVTKPAADSISEFGRQAQRNLQDAVGDTLAEAFQGNFDNIGRLWSQLLARMAAQAAAQRFNELLFGNGQDGSSGLLTNFFSNLFRNVAGTRAGGGPVGAGKTYLVGEQGPELFTAGSSGHITPAGQFGAGGMSVVIPQTINVAAGASRQDVLLAADQARRAAVAEVFNLMQRGRN